MGQLKVGYAAVDITPPVGAELLGYGFYLDRRAKSMHDPLFARAVVIDTGDERAVLLSCDIAGLTVQDSAQLSQMVERKYGIPTGNILLAYTHTHSGPMTLPLLGWGPMDEQYMSRLMHAVVDCVGEALTDISPARFGFKRGLVEPIGYNRVLDNDCVDPSLLALYFSRDGGEILAVNHACHPVVLGINEEISADYPGEIVKRLEQEGVSGLFLNGCCGNIDPRTQKEQWGSGTFENTACYGCSLADAALGMMKEIQLKDQISLTGARKTIGLPVQPPDRQQVEDHRREWLTKAEADPDDGLARFEVNWADNTLKAIDSGAVETEPPFVVQALKMADVTVIGLSGEIFWEIGQSIVERLDGKVMVVGYANGVTGYIPMPYDFENKGYAATLASKCFGTLPMTPDVASIVTDAAVDLANSL